MTTGVIFDIKRFALHDGPGLRTTLFLKGCPLSCLGCHNPEGQRPGPELLLRQDRCTECGDCLPVCPHEALSLGKDGIAVDWDRCDLAGACVEACVPGALEMVGRSVTVSEVLEIVERDRIYFDESGGGLTLSGGEPLGQADFVREILHACRERDVRVVLDTSGHVEPVVFRELTPLASHVLFDLKLMDEGRHEAFAGVHTRWIHENLAWAGAGFGAGPGRRPGLTVRIPLIPGFNDDAENLSAVGAFVSALERRPPVDVLPYHRLGVAKYNGLGREYKLDGVEPPPEADVMLAVRLLKEAGLTVSIRGVEDGDD
jgi:pyruvate formate lyase activating enzyme